MKREIHYSRHSCLTTHTFMLSYTTSHNSIIENLKIYKVNLMVIF
jgi:hypothetical protein